MEKRKSYKEKRRGNLFEDQAYKYQREMLRICRSANDLVRMISDFQSAILTKRNLLCRIPEDIFLNLPVPPH